MKATDDKMRLTDVIVLDGYYYKIKRGTNPLNIFSL